MGLLATSDAALLTRWRRHGDPTSFTALVDRHAAMVHATSTRILRDPALAEDVTQDCFMRLAQLQRFDGTSVGGWLHRVARNRALDHLRTQSHRREREQAFAESQTSPVAPETQAILKEIDAALDALPETLREPLVLHYLEGRTHREVARAVGVSRSTVTRRIQQALDQLRDQLDARGVSASVAAITAALLGARSTAIAGTLAAVLKKIALSPPAGAAAAASSMAPAIIGAAAVLVLLAAVTISRMIPAAPTNPVEITVPADTAPIAPTEPISQLASQSDSASRREPSADAVPALRNADPNVPLEKIVLKCIDEQGNPVPGVDVYIVRSEPNRPPDVGGRRVEEDTRTVFGPFTSDYSGRLPSLSFEGDQIDKHISYQAFARVPGQLVGAWNLLLQREFLRSVAKDEIVVVPSTTIEGRVLVPHGFDQQSVTVRLLSVLVRSARDPRGEFFYNASKSRGSTIPPLSEVRPDRHGRFRFNDVPVNGNIYIAATGPGLGETQYFQFDQSGDQQIQLEMQPESVIYGTVIRMPSRARIANQQVFARPRSESMRNLGIASAFVTSTSPTGDYRFEGLMAGSYDIYVYAHGDPLSWVAPVVSKVAVGVGEERGPVEVRYERGGWIEGRIRDRATGVPTEDAYVCALNPAEPGSQAIAVVPTDENGYYRILLPTGPSRLYLCAVPSGYAYPKDGGARNVSVEPNQNEPIQVDFLLDGTEPYQDPGTATISGRVVDALGRPLERVPIHDAQAGRNGWRQMLGLTGEDGRFLYEVRAEGTHQIQIGGGVFAPEGDEEVRFSLVEKDQFRPKKDESYDLGDAVVERYSEIVGGRVLDESGSPLADVEVHLAFTIRGHYGRITTTNQDGAFAFRFVPPGTYRLYVEHQGFEVLQLEVESNYEYDLTLNPKSPED